MRDSERDVAREGEVISPSRGMRRDERKRERTGETLLSVEERREKKKGKKEVEKEKNRESAVKGL